MCLVEIEMFVCFLCGFIREVLCVVIRMALNRWCYICDVVCGYIHVTSYVGIYI